MNTITANQQAIELITKSFDKNWVLLNPKNRQNQLDAINLLDSYDFNYEQINGMDIHICLLHIAYPNKSI